MQKRENPNALKEKVSISEGCGLTLVSACLLGIRCRYDARKRKMPREIRERLDGGEHFVPVCPEQLGGLPTPRPKNRVIWEGERPSVITEGGKDVTHEFLKGGRETLKIARLTGARLAVFQSRSPSCGEEGVTTRLLRTQGIEVKVIDSEADTDRD